MNNNSRKPTRFGAKTLLVVITALGLSSLHASAAQHMKKMMDHGKMEMGKMNKAAPAKAGDLMVSGAWARQSFGRAVNSAGFMTIKNGGAKDDVLVGARSPISEITELHTHIKDGDVMKMRRVNNGITIPKGASAELKPGGLHVMFIKLKAPLKAGVTFPVTLKFKNAGEVTINLTAQKMAKPKGMDHGKMDHGKTGMKKMDRGSH